MLWIEQARADRPFWVTGCAHRSHARHRSVVAADPGLPMGRRSRTLQQRPSSGYLLRSR